VISCDWSVFVPVAVWMKTLHGCVCTSLAGAVSRYFAVQGQGGVFIVFICSRCDKGGFSSGGLVVAVKHYNPLNSINDYY
jgi:hypothetical protein